MLYLQNIILFTVVRGILGNDNRQTKWGEFRLYLVLNENWLFLTLFLFPPKKRDEKKENE